MVALVRSVADAVSVYSPMIPLSEQPSKEAIPLEAITGLSVQAREPAEDARVTLALESVTVLPPTSSMVMTGWVVKAAPFAAPSGWVVTAN